jgi:hypothetical protein
MVKTVIAGMIAATTSEALTGTTGRNAMAVRAMNGEQT